MFRSLLCLRGWAHTDAEFFAHQMKNIAFPTYRHEFSMRWNWLHTCTNTGPSLSIIQRQAIKHHLCLNYLKLAGGQENRGGGASTEYTETDYELNSKHTKYNHGNCDSCHYQFYNVNHFICTYPALYWACGALFLVYSEVIACRYSNQMTHHRLALQFFFSQLEFSWTINT